jgi:tetratricopeptide (TPR) repeat protein
MVSVSRPSRVPMNRGWSLAGRDYALVEPLGQEEGLEWHLVRDERDGSRHLLELRSPRPRERELDRLKPAFLQRFTEARAEDPLECHFGVSDRQAWFLQALSGTPLSELWPELGPRPRRRFLDALRELCATLPRRVLFPQTLGILPGRMFVPRALGEEPLPFEALERDLLALDPGPDDETWAWEQPPELSLSVAHALRGRAQEMTVLKTLAYGLTAPLPMERIVVLHGEAGLGLDSLSRWMAAAAESEGIWVTRVWAQPDLLPGPFISQLLGELIQGIEADFYAANAEAVRRLSQRIPSFAFLRGGRRVLEGGAPLEPEELQAALAALRFAHRRNPRLIQVLALERASQELLNLLRSLVLEGDLPWLFTYGVTSPSSPLKSFLGHLRTDPNSAVIQLNRLEDGDVRAMAEDILGTHQVPDPILQQICQASLGNPALLAHILERCQQDGSLTWRPRGWDWKAGAPPDLEVHEDLVSQILIGRLKRLKPATRTLVRCLSLADQAVALGCLRQASGLAGEPFEEALATLVGFRLVDARDGTARLRDARVQDMVLAETLPAELTRCAQALLRALEGEPSPALPPVRLLSVALDPRAALDHLLLAIQAPPPAPMEAERVVRQAMKLEATEAQRAHLWEFLADAWAAGTTRSRIPEGGYGDRSPWERALDALSLAQGAAEGGLSEPDHLDFLVRLLRKRACLELRLGRTGEAHRSLLAASHLLADHPLHPEQVRLHWAYGRIHTLEGRPAEAMRAIQEGLRLAESAQDRMGRLDQIALLLDLGALQGQKSRFKQAVQTLQEAQLRLQQDLEARHQVQSHLHLAEIHMALGQPDQTYVQLRDALQGSRVQDDLELTALCHFSMGKLHSIAQSLDMALAHLDRAHACSARLGDRPARALAALWKARTVAALGDPMQADLLMVQALAEAPIHPSAQDLGDQAYLQAEIAGFARNWRAAAQLFGKAVACFEGSGLVWREYRARLRRVQALAQVDPAEEAWVQLEGMKAPVEGSGSRWLELEWHRAHGLLLKALEPGRAVDLQSLDAWNQVLAAARALRFHALVIEGSVEAADLLLRRGEPLGARTCLAEAATTFQLLWSRVPVEYGMTFQGRPDIHRFRLVLEAAGLPFTLPERSDPLADWNPTQTPIRMTIPFH